MLRLIAACLFVCFVGACNRSSEWNASLTCDTDPSDMSVRATGTNTAGETVILEYRKDRFVRVRMSLAGGGHELQFDRVRQDGEVAVLSVTLTSPAASEAVPQEQAKLTVERTWADVVSPTTQKIRIECRRGPRGAPAGSRYETLIEWRLLVLR
jgi:hypothetical protein